MTNQDERLKGNEKIETAIAALQQEPNDELLAHTGMKSKGFCPCRCRNPDQCTGCKSSGRHHLVGRLHQL